MSLDEITLEIKLVRSGQLRAFVDVNLPLQHGEIKLLGFRIIAGKSGSHWVAFPTISYTKNGKIINKPVIEMPSSARIKLTGRILKEFEQTSTDQNSFQPSSKV